MLCRFGSIFLVMVVMIIFVVKCWMLLIIVVDGVCIDGIMLLRILVRIGKVINEVVVVMLLMLIFWFWLKILVWVCLNIVMVSDKCSDFWGNGY